jgi:uncharacterized repeat protein (TIGR03803 family)
LILSGNTLYATAANGGELPSAGFDLGAGVVFAVHTNGTGFTSLHTFTQGPGAPSYTNSDGANPQAGLILLGNTLYGTAALGSSSGNGTVFAVNTDGSGFMNLHNFSVPPLPIPQLTISLAGTNVLLTWPSTFRWLSSAHSLFSSYHLQSSTNLGPFSVWSNVFPPPVLVNGQKVVADPHTGAQQFYRLILQTQQLTPCYSDDECPCGICFASSNSNGGIPYCAYDFDGTPCDQ